MFIEVPLYINKFSGGDMKSVKKKENAILKSLRGPSLYEVEYLKQLQEELKIFLRSKNVPTIKEIYVGFNGDNYRGQMQVRS